MMESLNEEEFNIHLASFYNDWDSYPIFINYFNMEWLPKKQKWSKAWRQVKYHIYILYINFYNIIKKILLIIIYFNYLGFSPKYGYE